MPFPIDADQLVIFGQQDAPGHLKVAFSRPDLEPVKDRGLRTVPWRNFTPLAAGSGHPDETIEDRTGVPWGTPTLLAVLLNAQRRFKARPKRIISLPDGGKVINLLLVELRRRQGLSLALSGQALSTSQFILR